MKRGKSKSSNRHGPNISRTLPVLSSLKLSDPLLNILVFPVHKRNTELHFWQVNFFLTLDSFRAPCNFIRKIFSSLEATNRFNIVTSRYDSMLAIKKYIARLYFPFCTYSCVLRCTISLYSLFRYKRSIFYCNILPRVILTINCKLYKT